MHSSLQAKSLCESSFHRHQSMTRMLYLAQNAEAFELGKIAILCRLFLAERKSLPKDSRHTSRVWRMVCAVFSWLARDQAIRGESDPAPLNKVSECGRAAILAPAVKHFTRAGHRRV